MPHASKPEIIRAIFAAYLSNDRKVVEDALTDDFRFTSPYDDEIDKATYFERCWRNSDWIERNELEKNLRRRRCGLCDLHVHRQGRQELPKHRIFHLQRRQSQTDRRLFRLDVREWRFRQAAFLASAVATARG